MVREHFAPIVNLADAWQQLATAQPEASALVHDGRIVTWADFAVRAGGLAHHLVTSGCRQQDTVTQFLRNTPHYLESIFACAAAGLVPVNTNHRYTDGELTYLWSNASVGAVIFAGEFTETCSRLRPAFPGIHAWVHVDDGSGACPEWATPYETAASSRPDGGNYAPPWPRTGDDLLLMYTGGTTGRPKGVMWRQADLIGALDLTRRTRLPAADPATAAQPPVHLAGAPLMHGTGQFNSISNLLAGGSVVTVPGRSFDPVALLDAVDANRVATMSIIGDVFARPLVDTVTADPHRWDLSSLQVIVSSGVMWSADVKTALLRLCPGVRLTDALGSSEAIGMAASTSTADASASTATFAPGPNTAVIRDDGTPVVPGSGESGRVAMTGFIPSGYFHDPVKTAETFPTLSGRRWSVPGDWATVDADGTIRLLGRGNQCINTGGEKVYPEEVEEVLKRHPDVADAAVVGVPDVRFGQAVVAIVEGTADPAALIDHVRRSLAGYKAPKRIVFVDTLDRAPTGKLNYPSLLARAVVATEP